MTAVHKDVSIEIVHHTIKAFHYHRIGFRIKVRVGYNLVREQKTAFVNIAVFVAHRFTRVALQDLSQLLTSESMNTCQSCSACGGIHKADSGGMGGCSTLSS